MSEAVIVAVVSLIGTIFGSCVGILTSNKLTVYRIEQLEKKVDRHNSVIDRVYKLEEGARLMEAQLANAGIFKSIPNNSQIKP